MTSESRAQYDFILFGAGIAGLWLLNVLKNRGFNCILLESGSIGGQQTIHSQGIIHGGLKYALSGTLTSEADSIAEMPDTWRQCLAGDIVGQPHLLGLGNTRVLSDTQFMWSTKGVASRFTTFFASKMLRGRIEKIERAAFPEVLASPMFKGSVYRLADLVIDTDSLLADLVAPVQPFIFKTGGKPAFDVSENNIAVSVDGQQLYCRHVVFCAGLGNGELIRAAGLKQEMQDRPLQMVAVKHQYNLPFYGHCIGSGSKPRITITSHRASSEEMVWYLGGELAESGVSMEPAELIEKAKQELAELFPWLDFSTAQWATWQGTRAEPKQNQLVKPDSAYLAKEGPFFCAWPTKLTLAPDLADKLLEAIKGLSPAGHDYREPGLALATLTAPFWETLFD